MGRAVGDARGDGSGLIAICITRLRPSTSLGMSEVGALPLDESVIPAKAGTQNNGRYWVLAFAGMTVDGWCDTPVPLIPSEVEGRRTVVQANS
jgi:hypothetical protein